MITAWLIGLILSFLGIWFLKNSRVPATVGWGGEVRKPERPVLMVWSLVLFIIGSLVPIINILMGIVIIIVWIIQVYGEGNWKFTKSNTKLIQFLRKPIK